MKSEHPSASQDYQPDPFELQIGAMVILHRAALLSHDKATHDELIQASNDYLWYGQFLEKCHGLTPPWDPNSENAVTPPEVFFESDELVGHMQSIPSPSLGMDHRHFRLTPRGEAESSQFGPTPSMAKSLAVVELVQHADKRWQVVHAEVKASHRRQGIATMLYDRIEAILETKLQPSGWLSEDAYRFWQHRGSPVLQYYVQVDFFPSMWISPKALLTLKTIAEAKLQSVKDLDDVKPL